MKTEQLKEWGLDDRQISMVMRENGRDIEAVKAKFSDYDMLKEKAAQLEQATALSEQAQQLRLRDDFCGHEVEDEKLQRTDVLMKSAVFRHYENVFVLQCCSRRQRIRDLDRHGRTSKR